MKALKTLLLCGLALIALAGTAAAGMAQGGSLLAIQVTGGDGDFILPEQGSGYTQSIRRSEMGVQGQYWYLMSEDYAVAVSAGIGWARETDNPGANALPGDASFRDFFSSWQFRVGGDRIGKVNDTFHLYAGPGIQFWGGKVEFKNGDTTVAESETATRIAVDGRIGAMLHWGQSFGMAGHIGTYWGYASGKDAGAEAKFTPTGLTSAMGVFFSF